MRQSGYECVVPCWEVPNSKALGDEHLTATIFGATHDQAHNDDLSCLIGDEQLNVGICGIRVQWHLTPDQIGDGIISISMKRSH